MLRAGEGSGLIQKVLLLFLLIGLSGGQLAAFGAPSSAVELRSYHRSVHETGSRLHRLFHHESTELPIIFRRETGGSEVLAAGSPETILVDDRVRAVYLGEAFRL